jgi:diacylglycerol kinase (ATP)
MKTFVNPRAAGGTAMRKWQKVLPSLGDSAVAPNVYVMDGFAAMEHTLVEALRSGETEFVAAGGDGTVNALLNLLLTHATPDQLARVSLGAIGLGSSNDFHNPFAPPSEIPSKIRFDSACLRDVGLVSYNDNGNVRTRYFLINASVGVTAAANLLFNNPDRILRVLKTFSTPTAIMYAALKTILRYRNIEATVQMPYSGPCRINLTNLAVLKNPHFSGDFRFPVDAVYDDGRFIVGLFHNMNTIDLLHALNELRGGGRLDGRKAVTWLTQMLTVTADRPFAVEFDGEVVSTTSVRFDLLPRYLKVCTC